jgi:hypothetical protein
MTSGKARVASDAHPRIGRVTTAQVAVASCVVGHHDVRGRKLRDARRQHLQLALRCERAAVERRQLDNLVGAEDGSVVFQFTEHQQRNLGLRIGDQSSGRQRLTGVLVKRTAIAMSHHQQRVLRRLRGTTRPGNNSTMRMGL